MNVLINENMKTYSKSEYLIMQEVLRVAAPIAVALRPKAQSWSQHWYGQTHHPYKNFVDLRNDCKLSIAQARQIIAKYEKLLNE